jgi:hypothetical protein
MGEFNAEVYTIEDGASYHKSAYISPNSILVTGRLKQYIVLAMCPGNPPVV